MHTQNRTHLHLFKNTALPQNSYRPIFLQTHGSALHSYRPMGVLFILTYRPMGAVLRIRIILIWIRIQDVKKFAADPGSGPHFDTDPDPGKNDTDPDPGQKGFSNKKI